MSKASKTAALGNRVRVKAYKVGKKQVIVWQYVNGHLNGMYYVSCSLYPEFNELCRSEDLAIERAVNIVSFHYRQLEISWG